MRRFSPLLWLLLRLLSGLLLAGLLLAGLLLAGLLLAGLLLAGLTGPARGQSVPSVLVTTARPVAGTLPDQVEAYGAALPATDATQALSLLQDGRVRRILHMAGEAVRKGAPILEWEASAPARQAGSRLAPRSLWLSSNRRIYPCCSIAIWQRATSWTRRPRRSLTPRRLWMRCVARVRTIRNKA